jgi:hypothetical protein
MVSHFKRKTWSERAEEQILIRIYGQEREEAIEGWKNYIRRNYKIFTPHQIV